MVLSEFLIFQLLCTFLLLDCNCESNETETLASSNLVERIEESHQNNIDNNNIFELEIIDIDILPEYGNAVSLSWGQPIREYNLNWTYGVYYGLNTDEALKAPKLTTKHLCAVVRNLEFCTQYIFAVAILNYDAPNKNSGRPQLVRSAGTFTDGRLPPENLRVDFIPDDPPCLLIKWSASCPNIGKPLGYLVTVIEENSSRIAIITLPPTRDVDLNKMLRAVYGKTYQIKVSTDISGGVSTPIVTFDVPLFLQPYNVRLTSQSDGTFMLYWKEPFVPYYVGPYYYEIYVYPHRNFSSKYETFQVNKPIFIFNGNETEYTFMISLRSCDGGFKSHPTNPVAKTLNGDAEVIQVEL